MARQLAGLGATLVICGRDERSLEDARRDLEIAGAEVLAVPCDVGDYHQVQELVRRATARFGDVDVLINNAGIISVGPAQAQTLEDFEQSMRVMFWGMVYPTMAVLPWMRERRGGRIVNITSIGGKLSFPHLLPYNSAKFAAVGFSEGLRAEVVSDGISVTTVVPGLMRTGSHLNARFKAKHRAEFGWFGAGATTPGMAMKAERAARRILSAAARGKPEITLTPQAKAAALAAAVFPNLTSRMLGLVNRLLPNEGGLGTGQRAGHESISPFAALVTVGGRRPARRLHQLARGQ